MAPYLLLLWADAHAYGIGSVLDGTNAGSIDVFLGVMLWVGSHECGCCIASAVGQEEEEEQLCFSIPG